VTLSPDSPSSVGPELRVGDILAGKYRVDGVIGRGGMGIVVGAHHVHLDQRVAIKLLLPDMLSNGEAVGRFAREARAAAKIKSEHVARVFDVGTLDTGAPYMVMEFLEGSDLSTWLHERGMLSIEQAIEFVLQACIAVADAVDLVLQAAVAIAEAHTLGIVHRDLKPANLFCIRRNDGQQIIKVLDFGISKMTIVGSDFGSMTRTSALMGSPYYMSPEQMQSSKDVDATTDIWALGVILYELLSKRVPFPGESVAEVAIKTATQAPPPLRPARPDLPPGLEAVIMKCLEKDRTLRYRNVGELAIALLPYGPARARLSVERISGILHAGGVSSGTLALSPSPQDLNAAFRLEGTIPSTVETLAIGHDTLSPSRGRKVALWTGASLLLVAGVGAAAVFVRHPGDQRVASEPSLAATATRSAAAATLSAAAVPLPVETLPSTPPADLAPTAKAPQPATSVERADSVINPALAATRTNHASTPNSASKKKSAAPAAVTPEHATVPAQVSPPPAAAPAAAAPLRPESIPDPLQNLQMKN
jgi:serine/threonine protein kinase